MKELNKTVHDLKMERESLKKTQRETALKMENLGKRTGVIDANIINRTQKIKQRISAAEDTKEDIDTSQGKYKKQKALISKNSRNPGHNKKTKPQNNRHGRE